MPTHPNPVAVVTGAASGIGWALTSRLVAAGVHVVMADRDEVALTERAASLAPTAVTAEVVDVTVDLPALIERTVARCGRLDYLFNNAGIGGTLPFHQADDDHWERILALNLHSVIAGTRAAYEVFRRQGHGHIVNTASVAGLFPAPGQSLYNTTKYAVVGLSTTLRLEAARFGVRVTVVCPGRVATPIWGTPLRGARVAATAPRGSMSADAAAAAIWRGVRRNRAIIVVPWRARVWWSTYRHAPRLSAARSARRLRRRTDA